MKFPCFQESISSSFLLSNWQSWVISQECGNYTCFRPPASVLFPDRLPAALPANCSRYVHTDAVEPASAFVYNGRIGPDPIVLKPEDTDYDQTF